MKQKVMSIIIVFTLLFSFTSFADNGTAASAEPASKSIVIIHTNDVHSRVDESPGLGYAKLAALASRKASELGTEPILVDAGDALHGQTIATITRGESIVRIMNTVGYDVMVPGNHDFNYGSERLLELASLAKFSIISANIRKNDGSRLLEPYTIIERDGVKVAFFGLSTPETAYKTNPRNVTGLTFADPVEEARAMADLLDDMADVIVCVTHLGLDESSLETSRLIARQVSGIDLIIDGHSHTELSEPLKVGNTLIVQTGEYMQNAGIVQISLDRSNKILSISGSLYPVEQGAELTPDADILAAIEEYKAAQQQILAEVIATSEIDLDGERANVRTGPTNLADLITSAMVAETGADAAITNGGGIRASIRAGRITRGDIITVLPFGNYIVTKKMKGSDILAALEHGLSAYPDQNGGFPQAANIEYLFDPSKPAGQRVTYAWVKGVRLDPGKEYIVATNDFMAAGGDGYPFEDLPLVNEFGSLDEALISFIQNNPGVLKYNRYVIQPGDAIWKIARKTGVNWQILVIINQLRNPDLIYAGDTLLVPAW
ncbi:MAG: LysM peptidoglycan-binding domain-containing protein [Clostridiaceae bacterium]|nr:LysM peptidoglycan-binding domain-containing protein [Clostridiaceae bacterium]